MLSKTYLYFGIALIVVSSLMAFVPSHTTHEGCSSAWGFFGHRRINRMAVFTLPPEMIKFYKRNIEYITEHAVDPDKRRYATKHEAVRHYIDIDHWGTYPYDNVPRNWTDMLIQYTDLYSINTQNDTTHIFGEGVTNKEQDFYFQKGGSIEVGEYKDFFIDNILPQYYEDEWVLDCTLASELFKLTDCTKVIAKDRFSSYGILPYHLEAMQRGLTKAFKDADTDKILRLSAEFGHYIGDAHVPLHTTENYNGQMTNQVGIHAFWESRIPELFADTEYDYFVGKADKILDVNDYYWDMVLTSHSYVDSVLQIEKDMSINYPQDEQYCYDQRLGRTVRVECRAYAEAYQTRMNDLQETRMRDAILAVGEAWYTAWLDAGRPDLENLDTYSQTLEAEAAQKELDAQYKGGDIKGREH